MAPLTPRPFRIALSLTGGVSTGAYLAGVMDFLVEALDALQDAQDDGAAAAPPHRVLLEAICGASSGALTAGVVASSLAYRFESVTAGADAQRQAANPLFRSWVLATGFEQLLGTGDADRDGLESLLDSTALDGVVRDALSFGAGRPIRARRWIAEPLQVCFSVTDLEGVRYSLGHGAAPVTTPAPAALPTATNHADVLRFKLWRGTPTASASQPDEQTLRFPLDPGIPRSDDWRLLGSAAVASAAFPLLFAPVRLALTSTHAVGPTVVLPGGGGRAARAARLIRAGSASGGGAQGRRFTAVDGGIVDNSPTDLARACLNGRDPLATNERNGSVATKAVLTIDPLLEESRPRLATGGAWGVLAAIRALPGALLDQARFRPEEIALAQDPNVFSRFLIAPDRGGQVVGGAALAGASVHAFGGYLAEEFRQHDFLLGRRNAQRYLATQLTLPIDNPLFTGWKSSRHYARWLDRYAVDGAGSRRLELPIVPLVGDLHPDVFELPLPDWPKDKADLDRLAVSLEARLAFIGKRLLASWTPGFFGSIAKLAARLAWPLFRLWLLDLLVRWIGRRLREHGLRTPGDGSTVD